jgi:hypothetical protein
VAAISHAIFQGNAAGGSSTAAAAVGAAGTPTTVVRTPNDYATYAFAKKSRVQASAAAIARQQAHAAREAALRAAVLSRHADVNAGAGTMVVEPALDETGSPGSAVVSFAGTI